MTTNAELFERRRAAVPLGVSNASAVFADHAENSEVWDVEGRRYIDFAGGIGVLNSGHRHPQVLQAVREQLDKCMHTCFQVMLYEPYVALAERLNGLAPIAGPAKTLLVTTGAEAVENAVKIARGATGRSAVIAFSGAFHGRTFMTMALTGKVAPYKQAFGPMPAEVFHVPFPVEQYGVTVKDSLRALEMLFKADVAPTSVAAIIIEPVQGEGGFHVAPDELLVALRRICDSHGILLIADEIQCGFGRTGRMFALEHSGVRADLMTVAKSLAGGMPLAGVIGRAEIMDRIGPGGLGGTYAGNPLACAAALAVLDVFEKEKLLDRSAAIGATIRSRLQGFAQRTDLVPISAIRGRGSMLAFDVVKQPGTHDPDADAARRVAARGFERGLILLTCGVYANSVRVLVPLTVPETVLKEGLDILESALKRAD
ncbi:MAG: 4-aminobutyrate--2-oxoglutarate transaminase [Proteobacteria bacterium]|nr:4-aminobutyrate--2-oxoglutarate transaminase [Pseudomonadota bacterium]